MSERVYFRVVLETQSSLSIGGADSVLTDADVVLDSRGKPIIPASSICGALRSHMNGETASRIFGDLSEGESAIRMYDAVHEDGGNETVSVRDSVRLKERVVERGAKFDRQIVEKGARFCFLIEILEPRRCPEADVVSLLSCLQSGLIALGAKKTRGMGRVSIIEYKVRRFNLDDSSQLEQWLAFDAFDALTWKDENNLAGTLTETSNRMDEAVIELDLVQRSGVCVRDYTTDPDSYDFCQLVVHSSLNGGGDDGVPLIPGTSWAGVIREGYRKFAHDDNEERTKRLFGSIGSEDSHQSRISFSETTLDSSGGDDAWKEYTRVAIDRFTGGAMDRSLFTTRSYYGGRCTLRIGIQRVGELSENDMLPLIAALADLHNGFATVGGQASVGYGLFRIEGARLKVGDDDRSQRFAAAMLKPSSDSDLIAPDLAAVSSLIVSSSLKEVEVQC